MPVKMDLADTLTSQGGDEMLTNARMLSLFQGNLGHLFFHLFIQFILAVLLIVKARDTQCLISCRSRDGFYPLI